MSPEAGVVIGSWQQVLQSKTNFADVFYEQLFVLDPTLRALFSPHLGEQKGKLMQMLSQVMVSLHAPDDLLPALRTLGARHAYYRVDDEHYRSVGQALLRALRSSLGDAYVPEIEAAWLRTYAFLSSTMIEAAHTALSYGRGPSTSAD
jgi:methyl-accepting chemotaxis protein